MSSLGSDSTRLRTIAFVGSLLPARFLLDHGQKLDVREIVVLNRTHQRSFEYVSQHVSGSRVTRLWGGPLVAAVLLAQHLFLAKVLGRRVLFFHECCWPLFDLIVTALRPRGLFAPQVTLDGFDTISLEEWPLPVSWSRRFARRLLRPLLHNFTVYRVAKDSGESGFNYMLAATGYPDSIQVTPVARGAERSGTRTAPRAIAPGAMPRILLVGGTEPVPDAVLRRLYTAVAEIGRSEGYDVFFKDHPIHGMGFSSSSCEVIDSALPIELVVDHFAFSIGVASTAIFGVGDRKISLIKLLDEMPESTRQVRLTRLLCHPQSDPDRIEFVSDLEALRHTLREAKGPAAVRTSRAPSPDNGP